MKCGGARTAPLRHLKPLEPFSCVSQFLPSLSLLLFFSLKPLFEASMAAGISAARAFLSGQNLLFNSKPILPFNPSSLFPPSILRPLRISPAKKLTTLTLCSVTEEKKQSFPEIEKEQKNPEEKSDVEKKINLVTVRVAERLKRKKAERFTYLIAAIMSSLGITSMAILSVYYRFSWQMEGGEISVEEMVGTFGLSVGAAVGMEFWARWAHKALWHASLWHMHESHHRPRDGPFELNDVFAIINAGPAIALLYYGFFHKGIVPGLCFGAGLGITMFGMAYMFVHDGLVHQRFSVGPIENVPYLRKVAAAHKIHHTDKFNGVPYGLFLGPKELEEVGGDEELEKEINRRIKRSNGSKSSS